MMIMLRVSALILIASLTAFAVQKPPVVAVGSATLYNGAIDDQPRKESLSLLNATNYVQAALTDAFAGKPVAISTSIPYGCEVHCGRTP